ncbi:uncharacterized protein KNAG_0C01520 [Huiozyma naganishii CBS 8797]|uniref:Uncharacterized protein n=1 Tax=Huiozyma naganishii (strain ATCC MYA-139 / BCRC 22969 / CBS 8797 / KCTC 17520 / NBRC 10181 / NCYC 3082 / Yp74L-3) TaxID=1071383 RepID=J7R356_HUIN7|nr:hypothetical protein KNAG_0C01520 [Kazachstania naganishii CBS 8797]CCK69265.1 hypothetical protein KNAG_0C01520 [Kazachstania naganishii CBS 8797]
MPCNIVYIYQAKRVGQRDEKAEDKPSARTELSEPSTTRGRGCSYCSRALCAPRLPQQLLLSSCCGSHSLQRSARCEGCPWTSCGTAFRTRFCVTRSALFFAQWRGEHSTAPLSIYLLDRAWHCKCCHSLRELPTTVTVIPVGQLLHNKKCSCVCVCVFSTIPSRAIPQSRDMV